ncbi:MAG: transcription antitermination factor NusB [Nitrospinaceae bacterium]|jgi:N utilization substance protein B|nr:transcription antitermination factor NusB [Nitrospinaceae bacterium]MDP7057125.1 transcription antitermination factor NusB [Nitrospinaceae bacterium]HAK38209.1 transcription antitermination factor NusB [Nitrospina sp.]|tara:strand:+ start:1588 stop:2022 length:435 start_codon:yes stop_codon:yes gene_type:complete
MGKRRSSRELALKFLYQFELNEGNVDEQMNSFIELNSLKDEIEVFMKELVEAVIKQKTEIDEIIQKFSENWLLDRMTVIDRNILRIGTCELLSDFSTPPKVVINEAVDIAKKFGNEDSPEFINGILDKIYKEIGHKKGPLSFTG